MYRKKIIIYLCFALSMVSIISGVYLVINSFRHEVLDEKYIVEKSTGFNSEQKDLSKGQVSVDKKVKYISQGNYMILLKINYNRDDKNILFANKSKISITDIIGEGYKLDTDKVYINKDPIKLYSNNTVTSDYEINYDNDTFEISFPQDKMFKYNTITLYIKLIGRDIDKEYITSKESYYSFTPNAKNDFYSKKTMQSYIINGSGCIVLKSK